jgi:hypothetical protein
MLNSEFHAHCRSLDRGRLSVAMMAAMAFLPRSVTRSRCVPSYADQHALAPHIAEAREIARMLHVLRRKVEGDS